MSAWPSKRSSRADRFAAAAVGESGRLGRRKCQLRWRAGGIGGLHGGFRQIADEATGIFQLAFDLNRPRERMRRLQRDSTQQALGVLDVHARQEAKLQTGSGFARADDFSDGTALALRREEDPLLLKFQIR